MTTTNTTKPNTTPSTPPTRRTPEEREFLARFEKLNGPMTEQQENLFLLQARQFGDL